MAIDSAVKRRAVAGVTFPLAVSVTPDNDEGETWRSSVGWTYYIEATALSIAVKNALGPDLTTRYLGPD